MTSRTWLSAEEWRAKRESTADLRRIGVRVRGRLAKAQDARQLPVSTFRAKKRQVVYSVFVHADRAAGEIKANVVVEGLGWAIPAAGNPETAAGWIETDGVDLIARIDRIVGRADMGVTGTTRFILPEAP